MVTAVLNRPTLVLNRNWQPVGVATVAKSLVKVWNDTARIVDPDDYCQYSWSDWAQLIPADDELVIRTRSNRLRVPEVIVLTSYDRLPSNNLISRREETAAMRSQANTAKLLADNPVLMRLRELEVLEKIAAAGKLNIVLGEKGLADKVVNLL